MLPNKTSEIDRATIELAKSGDAAAISLIVNKYQNYLLSIAHRRLEPSLAGRVSPSDIVQDTVAGLPQKIGAFAGQSEQELEAWLRASLCGALKNARRFHLKDQRPVVNVMNSPNSPFEDSDTPSKQMRTVERRSALEKCLKQLSDSEQNVLRMRHEEGLSFVEIGKAVGVSADTARMSWGSAIERLNILLSKDGDL